MNDEFDNWRSALERVRRYPDSEIWTYVILWHNGWTLTPAPGALVEIRRARPLRFFELRDGHAREWERSTTPWPGVLPRMEAFAVGEVRPVARVDL